MASPERVIRGAALLTGFVLVVMALQVGGAAAAADTDDGNVTLYRGTDVGYADADAVEAAIANGTLEPADELVVGDRLVAVIESDRLADAMADGDGSTTDRFFAALDGDATFRFDQTNPTPEKSPKVAAVGQKNVTVHRAGTTVYVSVDTDALEFTYEGTNDKPAEVRDGDRFAVTFGYGLDEDDVSGPAVDFYTTTAEFVFQDRHEPLAPEVVNRAVRVNIEPDEGVVTRLTLAGNRTVTIPVEPVAWSGFPGVSLDLRAVEPGTAYALELVHDGTVVDRSNGTVLEPQARVSNATVTEVTTEHLVTEDGQRVTETIHDHTAVNVTVNLTHGGQVLVFNDSCEQVGYQWVEPGVETRVSVELWHVGQPIRGRDPGEYAVLVEAVRRDRGNTDPYPGPAANVTVNGGVRGCLETGPDTGNTADDPSTSVPNGTPVTPTTPATTVTPAVTTSETDGETPTDERTTTPGQPGFTGPAMVVTLLVATWIRARRP